MGNGHASSNYLTTEKRNWIAFYGRLQFVSDCIALVIIIQSFTVGLILNPLILMFILFLKKMWIILFDHRIMEDLDDGEE